jgi:uncharacterized protein HemX
MACRSCAWTLRSGLLLLAALPLCTGCALFGGNKLAACQAEKEQLLARIERDQHELQALRADQRRLAEAEMQLARMYERQATERMAALPDDDSTSLYTPPADGNSQSE